MICSTCIGVVQTTIVNGSCSLTHYNCAAGISASTVEDSIGYAWACNGLNGGTNIMCSESKGGGSVCLDRSSPPEGNLAMCPSGGGQGELWIGSTYSVQKFKQVRKNQSVPVGWDIGTWTGCTLAIVSGPPLSDWTGAAVPSTGTGAKTLPRLQPGDYTLKISCGTNQTNSIQILVTDPGTGEI